MSFNATGETAAYSVIYGLNAQFRDSMSYSDFMGRLSIEDIDQILPEKKLKLKDAWRRSIDGGLENAYKKFNKNLGGSGEYATLSQDFIDVMGQKQRAFDIAVATGSSPFTIGRDHSKNPKKIAHLMSVIQEYQFWRQLVNEAPRVQDKIFVKVGAYIKTEEPADASDNDDAGYAEHRARHGKIDPDMTPHAMEESLQSVLKIYGEEKMSERIWTYFTQRASQKLNQLVTAQVLRSTQNEFMWRIGPRPGETLHGSLRKQFVKKTKLQGRECTAEFLASLHQVEQQAEAAKTDIPYYMLKRGWDRVRIATSFGQIVEYIFWQLLLDDPEVMQVLESVGALNRPGVLAIQPEQGVVTYAAAAVPAQSTDADDDDSRLLMRYSAGQLQFSNPQLAAQFNAAQNFSASSVTASPSPYFPSQLAITGPNQVAVRPPGWLQASSSSSSYAPVAAAASSWIPSGQLALPAPSAMALYGSSSSSSSSSAAPQMLAIEGPKDLVLANQQIVALANRADDAEKRVTVVNQQLIQWQELSAKEVEQRLKLQQEYNEFIATANSTMSKWVADANNKAAALEREAQKKIDDALNQLASGNSTALVVKSQYDALRDSNGKLQEELRLVEFKAQTTSQAVSALTMEKQILENVVQGKDARIQIMNQELNGYLQSSAQKETELNKQILMLRAAVHTEKLTEQQTRDLANAEAAKVTRLNEDLQRANARILALEADVLARAGQLSAAKITQQKTDADLEAKKRENMQLSLKAATAETAYEEANRELKNTQVSLSTVTAAANSAKVEHDAKLARLQTQLDNLSGDRSSQVALLSHQVRGLEDSLAAVTGQKDELQVRYDQLVSLTGQHDADKGKLLAELTASELQVQALETHANDGAATHAQNLTSAFDFSKEELTKSEKDVVALRAELGDLIQKFTALQNKYRELKKSHKPMVSSTSSLFPAWTPEGPSGREHGLFASSLSKGPSGREHGLFASSLSSRHRSPSSSRSPSPVHNSSGRSRQARYLYTGKSKSKPADW